MQTEQIGKALADLDRAEALLAKSDKLDRERVIGMWAIKNLPVIRDTLTALRNGEEREKQAARDAGVPYGWIEPSTDNFVRHADKVAMPFDASTYTVPVYTAPPAPAPEARPVAVPRCEECGGHGYTDEGDPDIGSALMGCDACDGLGWAAPVGATLKDASRDPALTLEVARELLYATAAGIYRGEYAAPAVPEVDGMARLLAAARREYRDSDAAGDVLDWLDERVAALTPEGK